MTASARTRLKISLKQQTSQNSKSTTPQNAASLISQKLEAVKIEWSSWDSIQLMAFQVAEPLLVASIIATALQIPQLSSTLYLLVALCLTDKLLTTSEVWIRAKLILTIGVVAVAILTLVYKSVLYERFPEVPSDSQLQTWIGVYPGKALKTFSVDSIVAGMAIFLVPVYWVHLKQLKTQQTMTRIKQKHQISIKYHHPHFGTMEYQAYLIALTFFLLSSLCYQTLIPLLNQIIILALFMAWAKNHQTSYDTRKKCLLAMTCLSFGLLTAQYVIQYAWLFNMAMPVLQARPRLVQIVGLYTYQSSSLSAMQHVFTRVNIAFLAFGVVFTKLYLVSCSIHLKNIQNGNPPPIQKPVYFPTHYLLLASQCFCFVEAYMYHDFESIVPLCFVLIAFLPKKHFLTAQIAYWCFLPLMICVYVFYYSTNIYGALTWLKIDVSADVQDRWLVFGFYQMQVPPLNFTALFLTLLVLGGFTRIAYANESIPDKPEEKQRRVRDFTTLDKLIYLFLVNLDYFTLYCLTVVGLWKVDLYHLTIMAIFVWAALKPDSFKRNIIFVLLYVFAFTIARYVYSILPYLGYTYSKLEMLIGFKDIKDQGRLYFDYMPQVAQWCLILLLVLEYKRARFIGVDSQAREKKLNEIHKYLRKKQPRVQSFTFAVRVIFNASCVFFAFLFQFLLILWLRITLLNMGTLSLLLLMLYKYSANNGLDSLVRYWRAYQIWTAFVLWTIFLFQFFISVPQAQTFYNSLNPRTQAWIYWTGYYQFTDTLVFVYFLPYVTMFLLSIIFMSYFQVKLQAQKKNLIGNVGQYVPPSTPGRETYRSAVRLKAKQAKQRFSDMQWFFSYFIWRCKPLWGLFDFCAKLWLNIIIITVLAMSLYYQIGLLNLVLLTVYALQNCSLVSSRSDQCVKQERELFQQEAVEQRLCQSFVAEQDQRMLLGPVNLQPVCQQITATNSTVAQLTQKRYKVTDQELHNLHRQNEAETDELTHTNRAKYAFFYFTIVALALITSYACMFLTFTYQTTTTPSVTVNFIQSESNRNFALFLSFWSGVYYPNQGVLTPTDNFFTANWPLLLFLMLVLAEILAVKWLKNKFDTTEENVAVFEKITAEYQKYVLRKKQIEETGGRLDSHSSINSSVLEDETLTRVTHTQSPDELKTLQSAKKTQQVAQSVCTVLVQTAILLMWMSAGFKMNVLSYLMLGLIVLHTYRQISSPSLAYAMLLIIVLQYASACASLSVYNSPAPFPSQLLNSSSVFSQGTYPNPYNTYLAIPVYYNLTHNTTQVQVNDSTTATAEPVVNTAMLEWAGVFVGAKRLNGMWMDLAAVILLMTAIGFYKNCLVDMPLKVSESVQTQRLRLLAGQAQQPVIQIKMKESTYLWMGQVVIIMLIITTVFSQSLLGFIYFMFSMLLIQSQMTFFETADAPCGQIHILQWLQVYLLCDLLCQMAFQYPFAINSNLTQLLSNVGFDRIWLNYPTYLTFGVYLGPFSEVLTLNYSDLVTRGLTFTAVQFQLKILQSPSFTKFYNRILLENLSDAQKIQRTYTVMKNNSVLKQVVGEAQYFGNIHNMLSRVRAIVKDRELLNKPLMSSLPPQSQQQDHLEASQLMLDNLPAELEKSQVDFDNAYAGKLREKMLQKKLSIMDQFYLYVCNNYVLSLIYYPEQSITLNQVCESFEKGRTGVESNYERELSDKLRREVLDQMKIENENEPGFEAFYANNVPAKQLDCKHKTESAPVRWLQLLKRVVGSNLHFVCYFFMITCSITTGGWLYMFYPGAVFGYALMRGGRPTKNFWLVVVYYTQALIILQFFIQLRFWNLSNPNGFLTLFYNWNNLHNTGLIVIPRSDPSPSILLKYFWSEISVVVIVVMHVQIESKSGILDVENHNESETFDEALCRYLKLILPEGVYSQFEQRLTMALEEQLVKSGLMVHESPQRVWNEYEDLPSVSQSLEIPQLQRSRSKSFDRQRREPDPEVKIDLEREIVKFGVVEPKKKELSKSSSVFGSLFWDNDHFDQLFPERRQQKPGRDFYTTTLMLCIGMFLFIFVFFNRMTGVSQALTDTINTSFLSTPMILILMVLMIIMLFDRIFYRSAEFKSTLTEIQDYNTQERNPVVSPSITDQMRAMGLEVNEKNLASLNYQHAFLHRLMPSFAEKGPARVLKFYYVWALIILFHYFVFFYMCYQPSLCGLTTPYSCNQLNQNYSMLFFYCIVCAYLGFQATQIQTGLPEMKQGLTESYETASYYTYQVWLQIPLLFELKTIVDWTFTKSALDVFQYLKLAEVQTELYIAKCVNSGYALKKLGEPISQLMRYVTGFALILLCMSVVMIPLVLFSQLNIFGSTKNPVISGTLTFSIELSDYSTTSTLSLPLFQTNQILDNSELTETEFSMLGFGSQANAQTKLFKASQTQRIQFSKVSDSVWTITPPKLQLLRDALNSSISVDNTTTKRVDAVYHAKLQRQLNTNPYAEEIVRIPLNETTSNFTQQLLNMINCDSTNLTAMMRDDQDSILWLLTASNFGTRIDKPLITAGSQFQYFCNATYNYTNYWSMQMILPPGSPLNQSSTNQVFQAEGGFGMIVFNQPVLPPSFSTFGTTVAVFFVSFIMLVSSNLRSALITPASEIFVVDAIKTEDLLKMCQCIYIYRVQQNLENEEELYFLLIDIMRSPETLKSITGSSLKKKLD